MGCGARSLPLSEAYTLLEPAYRSRRDVLMRGAGEFGELRFMALVSSRTEPMTGNGRSK